MKRINGVGQPGEWRKFPNTRNKFLINTQDLMNQKAGPQGQLFKVLKRFFGCAPVLRTDALRQPFSIAVCGAACMVRIGKDWGSHVEKADGIEGGQAGPHAEGEGMRTVSA